MNGGIESLRPDDPLPNGVVFHIRPPKGAVGGQDGDLALEMDDVTTIVRELRPHFPPQDLSSTTQKIRYSDTNYMP